MRLERFAMTVLLLWAVGCSGGRTVPVEHLSPKMGPHGGVLASLPNNEGHGEIVFESKSPGSDMFIVFFLQDDATSPMTDLPENVAIALEYPDQDPKTISLRLDSKTEDPAGSARFVSDSGDYLVEPLIGTLSGTRNSQPFESHFHSGR